MRMVYLTIDNINDNVTLAQTLPLLRRLGALPGVDGIDLYALRKDRGERYLAHLPSGDLRVRIGQNRGVWHPLTLLQLVRFALAAWVRARDGALLIGRNPVSLLCLAPAGLRPRTRLVLDHRGVLSEEYVLQGKIARRGPAHRLLRRLERWATRRADVIACVSGRLRQRTRRWQPESARKIVVIPCCYDPGIGSMDDGAIERLRSALALDPTRNFVLAYAGSLSSWNRPEAILSVFRAFRAIYSWTRLLLLTEDLPAAQAYFSGEEGVILRSVPHGEIQHYLALADLGLLLRDRNSVNRVACPVKFAEYLACGLPVLVSPGVGDCSEIIRRERVGYILEDSLRLRQVVSEVRAHRGDFRRRCREVAARHFDGARYLPLYMRLVADGQEPMRQPQPAGSPKSQRQ